MQISQLRRYAMSLPEVTEEPHFQYNSFRVRGKIFVTVPPDEEYVHIFVPEQQRELALALDSDFLEKLFWGDKVVGLRATLGTAEPGVIKQLVSQAWASKAPKGLLGNYGATAKGGKA